MPYLPHLFSAHEKGDENDPTFQADWFQSDVQRLLILVGRACGDLFLPDDREKFRPIPQEIPQALFTVSRLLAANDFSRPGPFKKAAALTIALTQHPVILCTNAAVDRIMLWKMGAVIAVRVTQLYLVGAFLHPRDNWPGKAISPPVFPSRHFRGDFLHYVTYRNSNEPLASLAMIWELLTYMSNGNEPHKLPGLIDGECDPDAFNLPGIDVPCAQIAAEGWDYEPDNDG